MKVTNQMRGFIPTIHLADVPLPHPEKKFKDGDKLKCRVSEGLVKGGISIAERNRGV